FLAALLADRLGLGFLVVIEYDEPQRDLQRDREGHPAVVAFLDRVLRLTEVVRVELEQRVVVVAGNREYRLEDRLQTGLLTPLRRGVLLQKVLVGPLLYLDQIRDLDDRRDLSEILATAVPTLNRSCHTLSWGRPSGPGLTESLIAKQSSVPGRAYFTETVAPCSSSFFFISSASAFVTFSFTAFGAPSTRSLASFRPSPVSSRTTLMTWIFFSPAAPRMTSNSVFSSTAAAAAPPPAAPGTAAPAIGAAADPPPLSRHARGAARAPPAARPRDGRDCHRRRGRHAPLLLQELRELRRFQQRQLVELLGDLLYRCHRCLLYQRMGTRAVIRPCPAVKSFVPLLA